MGQVTCHKGMTSLPGNKEKWCNALFLPAFHPPTQNWILGANGREANWKGGKLGVPKEQKVFVDWGNGTQGSQSFTWILTGFLVPFFSCHFPLPPES